MPKHKLDISDKQTSFSNIAKKLEILDNGLRAMSMDYRHHLDSSSASTGGIYDLRENVSYRLFSAQMHYLLLLQQHLKFESQMDQLMVEDPQKVLGQYYPQNPLFRFAAKEVNSLFDSLVFHLASVYDYFAAAINYTCQKKSTSITYWNQLAKSCRDKNNSYYQLDISKIILNETNNFIDPLYKYRSRVIHEKSEMLDVTVNVAFKTGKTESKFFITKSLISHFSFLRGLNKENDVTIIYAADWLIMQTLSSISKILLAFKKEMEEKSTFPNHIGDNDLITMYRDPKTGIGYPSSHLSWIELAKEFELELE